MQTPQRLPSLIELDRELARRSFGAFVRSGWHILEPVAELKWGWALDAICEHLEAVTRGDIKQLLMNVPPGCMKSLLTGVFWPAWEWGPMERPGLRYLGTAHKQELATRDNMKCRRLIQSAWFQERWPLTLTGDQNAKTKFENDKTGFREAMAFNSMTGSRGDRVLLDDPLSVDAAKSPAELKSAELTFTEALPTRVNNTESAIVVIMQRLHEKDTSGIILKRELGYTHLCLPMRYEPKRKCSTSIGFVDPRTVDGELLFPERFPEAEVQRLERTLGSYATAGQLQQAPKPREGGMVKHAWLANRYKAPPVPELIRRIVQSWDTAKKDQVQNDYSVCTTWAETDNYYFLLDVWRDKVQFPDLKRAAVDQWAKWRPSAVLIEDAASGTSLIQQLSADTLMPVIPIGTKGIAKEARFEAVTPLFESGRVRLPEEAPWVADYIEEVTGFGGGIAHDDQADSTSQFLNWASKPSEIYIG